VNFDLAYLFQLSRSEMDAKVAGRCISDRCGHVVALRAEADSSPDAITIAHRPSEFHDQPRIFSRCHVLPKFGRFAKGGHYNVDLSIVVEIRECGAAMCAGG
jgi:hypothetical protein